MNILTTFSFLWIFRCLQCDSIFPSRQALDHHREQMDHYDFVSDYGSDTTSFESEEDVYDEDGEEKDRLLWHFNSSKCTSSKPVGSPSVPVSSSPNQNQIKSLNPSNSNGTIGTNFNNINSTRVTPPKEGDKVSGGQKMQQHRHIIQLRRFGRGCSTWV